MKVSASVSVKKLMLILTPIGFLLSSCHLGTSTTQLVNSKLANNYDHEVNVYVTNESEQFKQLSDIKFQYNLDESSTIVIDENKSYQTIEGFGAAITDSSAYLLYKLPEPQRTQTLEKIFSPINGAGMSLIRVPLGSSDFARYDYTYDDLKLLGQHHDVFLRHFSIVHDQEYIIPLLKMIKQINPQVEIIATPWSAPAWMKTNRSYDGTHDGQVGSLENYYMSSYAAYLTKAILAYQANGINIKYITLQNEPLFAPEGYGGMYMSAQQQSEFINHYITPAFITNHINTQVLAYDHNWDHAEYPQYVLQHLSNSAQSVVAGTAYHCYGGNVTEQSITHNEFSNKKLFMTECSGGDWATNFNDNLVWDMQNLFIGVLNNWGNGATKWNLALDQNHGPFVGGCTNCRGLLTVNTDTNAVEYNVDFYSTANMSKFIQLGAKRIASVNNNSKLNVVAVKNVDGKLATLLVNDSAIEQKIILEWEKQKLEFVLPAQSVATVVWH